MGLCHMGILLLPYPRYPDYFLSNFPEYIYVLNLHFYSMLFLLSHHNLHYLHIPSYQVGLYHLGTILFLYPRYLDYFILYYLYYLYVLHLHLYPLLLFLSLHHLHYLRILPSQMGLCLIGIILLSYPRYPD